MSTSESCMGVNSYTAVSYTSPEAVVLQCKLVSGRLADDLRSATPNGHYGLGLTKYVFTMLTRRLSACW